MWTNNNKTIVMIIILTVLNAVLFFAAINYAAPISKIPFSFLSLGLLLGMWYLIDKFILKGYDTLEELHKNNVAWGIVIGSILIAAAVLLS